ncbi:MAG: 2-phosphosulfolactate phosphatase [Oscillospiraceae bacterium]|nr:2-phosphosulfolactate phosphatase [Oscillospiraceae bacterium]
MKVEILELLEGARRARGTAVVIDVFRAFSVECYLAARGAARIIAVGSEELAYELKRQNPDALLVGERKGFPLPGFDVGNSPALLERFEVAGRSVVHTTSAGTQGLVAAAGAREILTGSLVNARAIADYLRSSAPEEVSLVCMGVNAVERADEDWLCARYIDALLRDEHWAPERWESELEALRLGTGERFFHPEWQSEMPEEDFFLCTARDRFPFVLRAEPMAEGAFEMHHVDVS